MVFILINNFLEALVDVRVGFILCPQNFNLFLNLLIAFLVGTCIRGKFIEFFCLLFKAFLELFDLFFEFLLFSLGSLELLLEIIFDGVGSWNLLFQSFSLLLFWFAVFLFFPLKIEFLIFLLLLDRNKLFFDRFLFFLQVLDLCILCLYGRFIHQLHVF